MNLALLLLAGLLPLQDSLKQAARKFVEKGDPVARQRLLKAFREGTKSDMYGAFFPMLMRRDSEVLKAMEANAEDKKLTALRRTHALTLLLHFGSGSRKTFLRIMRDPTGVTERPAAALSLVKMGDLKAGEEWLRTIERALRSEDEDERFRGKAWLALSQDLVEALPDYTTGKPEQGLITILAWKKRYAERSPYYRPGLPGGVVPFRMDLEAAFCEIPYSDWDFMFRKERREALQKAARSKGLKPDAIEEIKLTNEAEFSRDGDKTPTPVLVRILKRGHPVERLITMGILMRRKDPEAIELIGPLLMESDRGIAWSAASALEDLTGREFGVEEIFNFKGASPSQSEDAAIKKARAWWAEYRKRKEK